MDVVFEKNFGVWGVYERYVNDGETCMHLIALLEGEPKFRPTPPAAGEEE